jgi:hypothetical protein
MAKIPRLGQTIEVWDRVYLCWRVGLVIQMRATEFDCTVFRYNETFTTECYPKLKEDRIEGGWRFI